MRDLTGKVGKTYFPVCKRHQKSQNQYQRKSKTLRNRLETTYCIYQRYKTDSEKSKRRKSNKKIWKFTKNLTKLRETPEKLHENSRKLPKMKVTLLLLPFTTSHPNHRSQSDSPCPPEHFRIGSMKECHPYLTCSDVDNIR